MKEQIEQRIEELVDQAGFLVVELGVNPGSHGRGGQILMTIGGRLPEDTVGSTECTAVSKLVGGILEEEGLDDYFAGKYRLEVSTPGLTRKLKSDREFAFAIGRKVKVRFRGAGKGVPVPDEVFGLLASFDDVNISVDVGSETRVIKRSTIRVVQLDLL